MQNSSRTPLIPVPNRKTTTVLLFVWPCVTMSTIFISEMFSPLCWPSLTLIHKRLKLSHPNPLYQGCYVSFGYYIALTRVQQTAEDTTNLFRFIPTAQLWQRCFSCWNGGKETTTNGITLTLSCNEVTWLYYYYAH